MEVKSIDSRMRSLNKKYKTLERPGVTSEIWENLIKVIDLYLSACQSEAFELFYNLFIDNVESLRFSVVKEDSCLYRMRVGKSGYEEFSTDVEMSHIPFEYNHKVGNERYSIAGCPSLYLGSSVYVCWEEMRRPDFDYVNIGLFKARKKMKVIDVSNQNNYHFTNQKFADCLNLACSLPVVFPEDPFKPEYIIPQMLLQSIVRYNRSCSIEDKIEGIKYSSAHIKDSKLWIKFPENRKNILLFNNYVFPAIDRKETGISNDLNNLFQFWNCITYNKLKLMYPDFQSSRNDIYGCSVFGKIEDKLQKMPLWCVPIYDSDNPKGALSL